MCVQYFVHEAAFTQGGDPMIDLTLHLMTGGALLATTAIAIAALPWSDLEVGQSVTALREVTRLPGHLLSLGRRAAAPKIAAADPALVVVRS